MKNQQHIVRRTCGDGRWFPGETSNLRKMVENFISEAQINPITGRLAAALAPHAGYIYSGKTAGFVFRALREQASKGRGPQTVVIIGFSHSAMFKGTALMDGDAVRSPIGETLLDKAGAELMTRDRPLVFLDYSPHKIEHSAENEIPFVQLAAPKAELVVAIMGDHGAETREQLAAALNALAAKKSIFVVASTDMLHDPDYELVCRTDRETLKTVERMDENALARAWTPERQIFCGIGPVLVAMRFAREQGCERAVVLHYENSGDEHPESRGRWVVGYGAVVFPAASE